LQSVSVVSTQHMTSASARFLALKLTFAYVACGRQTHSSDESDVDDRDDTEVLLEELEREEEDDELLQEGLEVEASRMLFHVEVGMGGKGQSSTSTKSVVSTRDIVSASNGTFTFDRLGDDYVRHINKANAQLVYTHIARSLLTPHHSLVNARHPFLIVFTTHSLLAATQSSTLTVHSSIVARSIAKGRLVHEALRTAASLPLDMVFDRDEVGGHLSNARIRKMSQVETRPKVLFAMAVEERGLTQAMEDQGLKHTRGRKGVKSSGAAKERIFRVPKGITVVDFSGLFSRLRTLASEKAHFFVTAIHSGSVNDFSTMMIRIPPSTRLDAGSHRLDRVQRLAGAVVAPFHRSRRVLRSMAFHLRLSGLMKKSRGTEQSYWGYTACSARETAICAVAYGVDEGRLLGDHPSQHRSLRIPTLVHKKYVCEGKICMPQHLRQLTIAQRKHCDAMVSSGPWPGPCANIFADGIETLGEACSSALLLLLAAASPDHAESFLQSVRKPVRLGGKASLAMHTTMAFYSTGPLLAEAELYLAEVESGHPTETQPPGCLLQQSASSCIEEHCSWALPKLTTGCRKTLERERATPREPLDTMQAVFKSGTPAAARSLLNDLAASTPPRIDKSEVCALPLVLSNRARTAHTIVLHSLT
jgi:hypothetical protein